MLIFTEQFFLIYLNNSLFVPLPIIVLKTYYKSNNQSINQILGVSLIFGIEQHL